MVGKVVISAISIVLVIGVIIGTIIAVHTKDEETNDKLSPQMKAVSQFCAVVDFKDSCVKTLNNAHTTDAKELIKALFQDTHVAVRKVYNLSDSLIADATKKNDNSTKNALEDCKELMDFADDQLNTSLSLVNATDVKKIDGHAVELSSWLSSVIAYQETCFDGFEANRMEIKRTMQEGMVDSTQSSSNALAVVSQLPKILSNLGIKVDSSSHSRRLLQDGYPCWLLVADRKLLEENDNSTGNNITAKANAVVAKDGSGQYKTIQEALDAYPNNLTGSNRYVIYIKEGVYDEYITVTKEQKNVLMIGDGNTKTVVNGDKSYSGGFKSWKTATFAAIGTGFIAKNMGFVNGAGPDGRQAVALRIQADMSAIFDCRIDGYQETLHTLSLRQFYRNCIISGTIDIISGDATAIIQSSLIIVRKSSAIDHTVTAQARNLQRETTGLVIQNCTIVPDEDLYTDRFVSKTYLGRPRKEQARTVFLENTFGDFIQHAGYTPSNGDFGLQTCQYYEYGNGGPGADTDKRVKWLGVKDITKDEAQTYTVTQFMQGDQWLKDAEIPFSAGLIR